MYSGIVGMHYQFIPSKIRKTPLRGLRGGHLHMYLSMVFHLCKSYYLVFPRIVNTVRRVHTNNQHTEEHVEGPRSRHETHNACNVARCQLIRGRPEDID